MKVLISASNDFVKWLGLDLPRIPSIDGQRVGTQIITSDETTLSWQCQALREHSRAQVATVIAVEASSRYCIIFPNLIKMTMAKFEQELKRRWLKEILIMAVESGAVNNADIDVMEKQFIDTTMEFSWFKNTDLSVNGHVADTEQWIRSGSVLHRVNYLGEVEAFELAFDINKMRKKVKISTKKRLHERFVPVARLLDDALFRFAKGASHNHYPDVAMGNFPNPYQQYRIQKHNQLVAHGQVKETPSNVIYLEQYKGVKNEL